MMIVAAALLAVGALLFTLLIRARDLPEPEPVSPTGHLEERKATIYDNLRDLQFEYRLGKLSDADYQQTKLDLQRELAAVLAQMEGAPQDIKAAPVGKTCPHCGAIFPTPLKFCGECGKPMSGEAQA